MAKKRASGEPFSNRALLQRAREPVFLLNRKCRLRFANSAWEQLTGESLEDSYGLICTPRAATELAQTLSPTPEVLAGAPAGVRRPAPKARTGPPWWDIAFLPLSGPDGLLGIIGRITVIGGTPEKKGRPLPAELTQLRLNLPHRFRLELLQSDEPACQRLVEQVRLASQHRAPVALLGEPGTGKSRLARTIHHLGVTAEQHFVAVDCAALPPTAQEAMLFGDIGLAQPDQVGTIYLREAAALAPELQPRLAEWLRNRPANGPRIISGFRREPAEEVLAGRLAPSLQFLLSVQGMRVPPLRDRVEDLTRFAAALSERAQRAGGPGFAGIAPEALQILRAYPWPGNLRELDAALESAARLANGAMIEPAHLPEAIRAVVARTETIAGTVQPRDPRKVQMREILDGVERRLIVTALAKTKGDKTAAAQQLGIWRETLLRRIKTLKIRDEDWRKTGSGK